MESNYRSSLVLSRANVNIQSIAAQLRENNSAADLRRLYTALAAFSKRALQAVGEASKATGPVNGDG